LLPKAPESNFSPLDKQRPVAGVKAGNDAAGYILVVILKSNGNSFYSQQLLAALNLH